MPIPQTGPVVSEPLPPPAYPGSAPSPTIGGLPPAQPEPLPPPSAPAPPSVAASPAPSPGSRGSAVGTWTARDATGSTCRVTLSSASALDLYKASASGCANRDLQRVNAWKQDGGEIYLYSAGSVVARVPANGGGGVLARSGAPVTLSR